MEIRRRESFLTVWPKFVDQGLASSRLLYLSARNALLGLARWATSALGPGRMAGMKRGEVKWREVRGKKRGGGGYMDGMGFSKEL